MKKLVKETQQENWKVIEGFPDYDISDLGNVRSRRVTTSYSPHPKALKTWKKPGHYVQVALTPQNGARSTLSVHRLVAQAFLPNPENHPIVNHKDHDKHNAALTNLEWTNHRGNMDAYKEIGAPKVYAARKAAVASLEKIKLQLISNALQLCGDNHKLLKAVTSAVMSA